MDHIHQRMYFTNKDKLIAYKLMIKKKDFSTWNCTAWQRKVTVLAYF